MTDRRLIEEWLPIAALSEESVRERRSMTALPPLYYLHIWWARRPLIASRAAILASVLPSDADHKKFMQALGIHGDPVKARDAILAANKTGADLGPNPYGYPRAFQYTPSISDKTWAAKSASIASLDSITVLDPTAGGGSIPLEAGRLGLSVQANDINPVAALLLRSVLQAPLMHGSKLKVRFDELAKKWHQRVASALTGVYGTPNKNERVVGYVWSRTIRCPYCDGVVPLSPHWRLAPGGCGLDIKPNLSFGPNTPDRCCQPEIVNIKAAHSQGTISDGDALCPYPDCNRIINGDEVKKQAQDGKMGEQLMAVACKRLSNNSTNGRGRAKWERHYRMPTISEKSFSEIPTHEDDIFLQWSINNILPTESIEDPSNYDRGHRMYGMYKWSDFFSHRQLYCHGMLVDKYNELLQEAHSKGTLSELERDAFIFLSFAIDKVVNFNCRQTRWGDNLERIVAKFDRHNYAMVWSYAEMPLVDTGDGLDWALEQASKCISEIIEMGPSAIKGGDGNLFDSLVAPNCHQTLTTTCKSGDNLNHLTNDSVDVVVMDPPYYDNVMYAELSDFFYVWLKRTAGHVIPELFTRQLTDKDNEAVANPAKFSGQKGAKILAGRDYQERMKAIFAECQRVLKPDGIATIMFTHKATGAWDALATGLMEAGFKITASWPINTEAEGSLHIKDKSAANSTIFLVCRPRDEAYPVNSGSPISCVLAEFNT